MKTRIAMIIALTITAAALLIGLRLRKHINNKPMEQTDTTIVAKRVLNLIILDESGSMLPIRKISVKGVNKTLNTIRAAYDEFPQQEQFVTFATFSDHPYNNGNYCRVKRGLQSITDVTNLKESEYIPNGGTPLWDTMGKLLTELEEKVTDEDLVLVTIITDGLENCSIEYDAESIRRLVGRLGEKGWVFTYIGANQDVALTAGQMGIRNYYQYSSDREGTRKMYENESRSRTRFYRNSRVGTMNDRIQKDYFVDEDK